MRNLVITAGPSEEPFRVMLPADDGTSAIDSRGRRVRLGGRANRSPQRFRWARPSRAMIVILRGLRATLSVLLPPESQSPSDADVAAFIETPPAPPRLRLVRDCGQALDMPAASPVVPRAAVLDAITPRHQVGGLRTRYRR
ncbi:hypothetical protein SSBR45G_67710 [Bradyrhizobium sp. SSBR45G]|uniref:hypothetical protein n=1 Tax=unclassified Bradyrhizobium TaxID=2631580 RepID=UPI002342A486|nr:MULTISPECIES: hypothetical protein [unclassified Bradyrhizobium]GLH81862.1 hypothetical protein SSBR45G_67710 [Bradyrhizobium sp. SSBR45G]GLH89341.1 hypothetical protein SSBR45R_68020 [Bradyrhizobium sp. SSBR45R]